MAFPTIQTTSQGSNAAGTSHPITLPSGIQAGDLLLVFFGTDGDNTITNWGGFTELDQQKDTKDIFGAVGYKIAVGSDTLTITTSVAEPSRYICYRIDGWDSAYAPEISTYVYDVTSYPNSASVTPSWSQDDTLWISACMNDNNSVVSDYPFEYVLSQLNQTGGNQDCGVAVSGKNLNSSSEDPPLWILDDPEQWFAWTIAVAPASAGCVPQTNSRIANATLTWQGACDVDIGDWVKTNEFILATWASGGDDANKNFKLQWKESGGTFADVGSDTEVCWGTGTSLVDGNTVATTSTCLTSTKSEENEGDNAAVLDTMGSSDVGEVQWALGFGSGAQDGVTYEFQLVNTSDTLTEVCSCSITTFIVGGYAIGIERGIHRGIL